MLAPVYLVNEYVLRRPIGAVFRHAERERWSDEVVQVFTFGEGGRNLIVPTALYDFGLLPSVGFYYAGDGVFASGNALRLHAATWGPKWINATAADRYAIDASDRVQARFEFKRSEDNLFFGIGPDVTGDARSRYGLERTEGSLGYRRTPSPASRFDIEAGVHRIAFVEGECCGDPSLDSRVGSGEVMPPPGYRAPYTSAFARVGLTLDSRRPRPDDGSGGYLHLEARPSVDLGDARAWVAYGGIAGAAVDLTGHRRTLRAQISLDFVDPITGGAVSFTEYPMLGGELMPGFVEGWLTDRSTAAAQLGYSWPVWLGFDAQARFTVGDAFGAHLDGFALRRLRMSGDFGFATSTAHDQGFELLFGVGTDTFDQGAGITSVRVALGSRRGF
ncbi:MAG TPA: hypothetical protein VK601_01305 [Kofleriaceae bacterium]|nr:hypothetical protein [Kofleriaceae bacterium]